MAKIKQRDRKPKEYAHDPNFVDWPDKALEVYAPSSVVMSMPIDCAECENGFWTGDTIIAVGESLLVHDLCFKHYAKKHKITHRAGR